MMGGDSTIVEDQYRALRDGRGFVELAGWSSVAVTGANRQTFLHNFCTNDIRRFTPGQGCEAFFTNVKGKTIGHGWVSCREQELVIVSVPGQSAKLIEHLDRYVIREDVQLRDTTAERNLVLVSDREVLWDAALLWMPWDLLGRRSCGLVEVLRNELPRLRETLTAQQVVACDLAAFEARIEAVVPLFGIDFNDDNLPQEVGRDDRAISFTKGCYLGQETVARIDALGHVNRQIAAVEFAGGVVPQPGMELQRAGAAAGHVTSAAFSPRLGKPLALAMLLRDALALGTELESADGSARVVTLPIERAIE